VNITRLSSTEVALAVWFSEEAIENWKHDGPAQQGAQWIVTDLAVKTCLQIKVVYGPTLRQTEGFVESIVGRVGLEEQMPVPDYTTLSKRQGDLDVEIQGSEASEPGEERPGEENVHLAGRFDRTESLRGGRMEAAHPREAKAAHLAKASSWRR